MPVTILIKALSAVGQAPVAYTATETISTLAALGAFFSYTSKRAHRQHPGAMIELRINDPESLKEIAGLCNDAVLPVSLMQELTERELAVAQLLDRDFTEKEIMNELCIEKNTLKTHRSRILAKLGIKNKQELMIVFKEYKQRFPDAVSKLA